MENLTALITAVAALVGAFGALLSGIASVLKSLGERTPVSPESTRSKNLWRTPVFVIGMVLIAISLAGFVTAIVISTSLPSAPPTVAGGLYKIFPQVDSGEPFAWIMPPGTLDYKYTTACRHSGSLGLQITYNFAQGEHGGWGVYWLKSPTYGFDASAYSALTFWIRGEKGGESFWVALKDTSNKEIKIESRELSVVTAVEWRQLRAPLSRFKNQGVNLAALDNMNLGFTRENGAGTLCIDDIAFVR